jgi:hypothetical protein
MGKVIVSRTISLDGVLEDFGGSEGFDSGARPSGRRQVRGGIERRRFP